MEKTMTGVALGRFNPVMHRGHQRAISTMLEVHGAESSLIMIGSSNKFDARNPLNYPQRRQLAQVLFPEVEIMPLPDIARGESDFDATMADWRRQLQAEADRRDTVFTFYGGSEADVAYMEPDFEVQSVGRTEVLPFSGTQVREALRAGDWENLYDMVDPKVLELLQRYYRFQVAQLLRPVKPFGPFHLNARLTAPSVYPERQKVPDSHVFWETAWEAYAPQYFVAPSVLANDRTRWSEADLMADSEIGWADPEDWRQVQLPKTSLLGRVRLDALGRPLNPMGRTGLAGRGLLGKWGPNLAVDPVVTRNNPQNGEREVLLIQRRSGLWGLPGGFVDRGDSVAKTLRKELLEETALDLAMDEAEVVYQGYVDSSRNTDNAWVETVAAHRHLPPELADFTPQFGSDAQDAKWQSLEAPDWPEHLVDTHAHILNMWQQQTS